ncbi:hypothetical protein [Derxia lacustris]|uniref:hypothetical protein n=1 Tax=Derxia lacustris TaxID=764842 RepID=UPI00111C5D5B|nr:hypothetical protein [Derxia lacustris]
MNNRVRELHAKPLDAEQSLRVHRAMTQLATQLGEFVRQIDAIQPSSCRELTLNEQLHFDALTIKNLFLEERRKPNDAVDSSLAGVRPFDHLLLGYRYEGNKTLTVERTLLPEIDRLERLLHSNRIGFDLDLARNERQQVTRGRFRIFSSIGAGIRVIPDAARGRIRFTLQNVDRFGIYEVIVEAGSINAPLIEELACCILGFGDGFRRYSLRF